MTLQRGHLSVVGDVRIVDGTETCGRLEVFAFDAWRAVGSIDFDNIDATVACMHMGFGYVCVYATTVMIRRRTISANN